MGPKKRSLEDNGQASDNEIPLEEDIRRYDAGKCRGILKELKLWKTIDLRKPVASLRNSLVKYYKVNNEFQPSVTQHFVDHSNGKDRNNESPDQSVRNSDEDDKAKDSDSDSLPDKWNKTGKAKANNSLIDQTVESAIDSNDDDNSKDSDADIVPDKALKLKSTDKARRSFVTKAVNKRQEKSDLRDSLSKVLSERVETTFTEIRDVNADDKRLWVFAGVADSKTQHLLTTYRFLGTKAMLNLEDRLDIFPKITTLNNRSNNSKMSCEKRGQKSCAYCTKTAGSYCLICTLDAGFGSEIHAYCNAKNSTCAIQHFNWHATKH